MAALGSARRFSSARCRSTDQRVQTAGKVAVLTHKVETDVALAGETVTKHERETIVVRHEAGAWIAFHEHLSVLPG